MGPGYPSQVPVGEGGASFISFILMDDPEHARLRRMVTAPFMIKRVEAMRPGVRKIVDELIDDMLAGPKPVDLVVAFALPVPSLVIPTASPSEASAGSMSGQPLSTGRMTPLMLLAASEARNTIAVACSRRWWRWSA